MADSRRTLGRNHAGTTELPPDDRPDFERLRHIRMLNEAQLVSFTATPNTLRPFGSRARVAWEVTMPTTVIPGVPVEVHLHWLADDIVGRAGSEEFQLSSDTRFSLYLKTHLAARELGTLDLNADFGACQLAECSAALFKAGIDVAVNEAFPPDGLMRLRGAGATVELHHNFFVISLPLEIRLNNWPNIDIDVSFTFDVKSEIGAFHVTHKSVSTTVTPGMLSALVSFGHSETAALVAGAVSDVFLARWDGPDIARRIKAQLDSLIESRRLQVQGASSPPASYRLHDFHLTPDGWTGQVCPEHPVRPERPVPTPGGGVVVDR